MSIKSSIKSLFPSLFPPLEKQGYEFVHEMLFPDGMDVAADIRTKYGYDGELLKYFVEEKGVAVHKWHHYIPLYDRYFSPFKGTPVRLLEIGVSNGGSLAMWRRFFGSEAVIYGIDIDPDCLRHDGVNGNVRIGSQDDPEFLASVVGEMGGVDIVLDDGSHMMQHIRSTLEVLFPKLSVGGLYFIEDLHCAYWRQYGGGHDSSENFFEYVRELTNDMHRWYHVQDMKHPEVSESCSAIHVHDSVVVLEKNSVFPPRNSVIS